MPTVRASPQPSDLAHLAPPQLRTMLATIHDILWEPPDQEWSPDTLDEIAQVLVSNGIGPRGRSLGDPPATPV